jgi:cysteine desulfurase family protein
MNRYFDNGSTSFPKPPQVSAAMQRYMQQVGGTYGRAAYGRVYEATSMVEQCRDELCRFLGATSAENLFFCANATTAINTIIKGLDLKGKRVLVSALEHNAVMRPLEAIKRNGVSVEVLPSLTDGTVDVARLKQLSLQNVGLVVVNHQSNVNGAIQPIAEISAWYKQIPILVDASQSAGYSDIYIDEWDIDFLSFTGHKGLLGPTGTGGFYAKNPELLAPFVHGGTGSQSDSFAMPSFAPDKFEAGTPNLVGIAGFLAGLENRPSPMYASNDFRFLIDGINALPGIVVLRALDIAKQGPLFSFYHRTIPSSQMAQQLFEEYGIEVRSGLHCAPAAHGFLGTLARGTVRIAVSPYHTKADFDFLLDAVKNIIAKSN